MPGIPGDPGARGWLETYGVVDASGAFTRGRARWAWRECSRRVSSRLPVPIIVEIVARQRGPEAEAVIYAALGMPRLLISLVTALTSTLPRLSSPSGGRSLVRLRAGWATRSKRFGSASIESQIRHGMIFASSDMAREIFRIVPDTPDEGRGPSRQPRQARGSKAQARRKPPVDAPAAPSSNALTFIQLKSSAYPVAQMIDVIPADARFSCASG